MKKTKQKDSAKSRREKTRDAQSSSVKRQNATAREAQTLIRRVNAKTVTSEKRAPKSSAGLVARVQSGMHPDSDLAKWARILSRPFQYEGIFCPVSYNPAPSFIQTTARTTSTNLSGSIGLNSSTQYTIFPGHGAFAGDMGVSGIEGAMDAVSYHAADITMSATRYVVGPMNKTDAGATRQAIIGGVVATALGTYTNDATAATALAWDVQLPYVSVSADGTQAGKHSRWQMVAMGVRFRQTTAELNRGGSFVTVQPNNTFLGTAGAAQSTLEQFPTFKDHGPEGFEISWIPRAQDLAFWHGTSNNTSSGANSNFTGPAMYVFINNPTASTLSFTYQIVCHWQLAGNYLNTVGREASHAPEVKPAVEKAVSVLQNGHPSAAPFEKLVSKAVDHSGAKSAGSWLDVANDLYHGVKSGVKTYGPRVASALA